MFSEQCSAKEGSFSLTLSLARRTSKRERKQSILWPARVPQILVSAATFVLFTLYTRPTDRQRRSREDPATRSSSSQKGFKPSTLWSAVLVRAPLYKHSLPKKWKKSSLPDFLFSHCALLNYDHHKHYLQADKKTFRTWKSRVFLSLVPLDSKFHLGKKWIRIFKCKN